jgi:nucleotide-binding universal stress UspA family protein
MIQIKNVLCPIDFFPASERALEYSIGLASNYGATLHLLHVVSPVLPTSYEFSINTADLVETFKKQATERVTEIESSAKAKGVTVRTAVRIGDIDQELQTSIEETEADLVVMGTHGRRGFERWFLGSVTERLLRHSPVPVLTMSDLDHAIAVPPDLERILVTTDFSDGTSAAMDYALALAQEAPAEIKLLHVVEQPPERKGSVEGIAGILEEHLDSMVPDAVRNWCTVSAEVKIGLPYQRILAAAEETKADLLVMNIHGKGIFERALLGATAERVLRGAECPVLAIPPAIESS